MDIAQRFPAGPQAKSPSAHVLRTGQPMLLAHIAPEDVEPARRTLREDLGVALSEIGEVVAGKGMVLVDAEGAETPLEPAGWDHFAPG